MEQNKNSNAEASKELNENTNTEPRKAPDELNENTNKPAAQKTTRMEKLLKTKKYKTLMDTENLYSIPANAVPGCGYILGLLLKNKGITRASELYKLFEEKREVEFGKYLVCTFGVWNVILVNTIIQALKDWEAVYKNKKEPEAKGKAEAKQKRPHKVGPGSKKWDAFMMIPDLSKVSVKVVPGIASILGCELARRGVTKAGQLMDKYKTEFKQDEAAFNKWILCYFGYWNTLYTKTVLAALKAYDEGHQGPAPLVDNGGSAKTQPQGQQPRSQQPAKEKEPAKVKEEPRNVNNNPEPSLTTDEKGEANGNRNAEPSGNRNAQPSGNQNAQPSGNQNAEPSRKVDAEPMELSVGSEEIQDQGTAR